jgi:hypothetical protein
VRRRGQQEDAKESNQEGALHSRSDILAPLRARAIIINLEMEVDGGALFFPPLRLG